MRYTMKRRKGSGITLDGTAATSACCVIAVPPRKRKVGSSGTPARQGRRRRPSFGTMFRYAVIVTLAVVLCLDGAGASVRNAASFVPSAVVRDPPSSRSLTSLRRSNPSARNGRVVVPNGPTRYGGSARNSMFPPPTSATALRSTMDGGGAAAGDDRQPSTSTAPGGGGNGNGDSPKRRKKPPRVNPLRFARIFWARLVQTRMVLTARFRALSKRARIVVAVQMFALCLVFGGVARKAVMSPSTTSSRPVEVNYSNFLDLCEMSGKGHKAGEHPAVKVTNVQIGREKITFRVNQDEEGHRRALSRENLVAGDDVAVKAVEERDAYAMKLPLGTSPELVQALRKNEIPFRAASNAAGKATAMGVRAFSLGLYVIFLTRLFKTMSGGGGGSPGKLAGAENVPLVKFDEIEGIDSAKFEVMELVDALRNPQKYAFLGARPPTGLLLVGPPGTGKTMLARATAATAGVPLLYCSGSDFVEMYVGRGAARVRKTFARAAKLAPCIVFIDEIDALGKARDRNGLRIQSNDEAEQTLNQLLACMDGLDSTKAVCVMAATNRREVLDGALTRPGRFDRIIELQLPDAAGRERILRVHAKKLPGFVEGRGVDEKRPTSLGKGHAVDLSAVAAVTPGLSGAELEFIVNEAAIRAVRRVGSQVRGGADPSKLRPRVEPTDFEASVANYYETRKPDRKGIDGLIENVFRR